MVLPEEERLLFRLEPTPEVINTAHETIRTHEASIREIEGRVQRLLGHVAELRHEQVKHRTVIERSWGIITIARRLPEELLIKIFGHCVEDGWTRAPLAVSHVCSSWRRAAHAPQVWSHVYVRCDDTNVFERTKFWLNMAGRTDLHLTIRASWRTPPWQFPALMKLLVNHANQWQTLNVETESYSQANRIFSACTHPMPQLRSIGAHIIAVEDAPPDGVSDLESLDAIFNVNTAPKLSSISLICGVTPTIPIFPSHLTRLSLNIQLSSPERLLSAAWILDILESLPELRILTLIMPLVYEGPFVPSQDPSRLIHASQLTTLVMYGPTDLNELLVHLDAPGLRHLHLRSLEDVGYRQRPVGPSLTRFLEQSSPPLELLELHDIDLSPEAFAACFAALPGLRELRLHESSISDRTVALLRGSRGLCPRLARVDFRWCSMLHGRALVDLVRSRCAVDDPTMPDSGQIEDIGVINCCFVLEEDVMDLARLTVCRVIMREGDDYCRE